MGELQFEYEGNRRGPRGREGVQGLPGPNAVPADEAVAAYVSGDANSATKDAFRIALGGAWYVAHFLSEAQRADVMSGTPTLDLTDTLQSIISECALAGGGRIVGLPGVYSILGTLIVPSRVHLDFAGVHLRGSGSNTVIKSGYVDAGVVVENPSEFDSGGNGIGIQSHYTEHATIDGVKITDCDVALRLHWFVQGSTVTNCDLDGSTYSVQATCSWGQTYHRNTIRATMHLSYYVDWTTITQNSFESCANYGIVIGAGGSWSMTISGNGFHWITEGVGTAIRLEGGLRNAVIRSNHFESCKRYIHGSANTCSGLDISQNHFGVVSFNHEWSALRAVEFEALRNSRIGPNDFEFGGSAVAADLEASYVLNTDACYYNTVEFEALTTGPLELSKATIRASNLVRHLSGSNTALSAQPTVAESAGTAGYTFERYARSYNYVQNQMPGCVVTREGATHTIDTHIAASATWVLQPAYFFFTVGGATNTYRISGRIAGRFTSAVFDSREKTDGGGTPPTVTFSHNAGKLRITISGIDNPSAITGWVKAI